MKKITIKDFIETRYRDYYRESNEHLNACLPHEQLLRVERHIIAAAARLGFTSGDVKVVTLGGEVLKGHTSGDSSVYETIKMMAQEYKRQPVSRFLKGVGNVGIVAGDPGAAARYLSVKPTPILKAAIKDLKYIDEVEDEGIMQPEYISLPIPIMLINGMSQIGTGKASYFGERDAKEVLDWVDKMSKEDDWTIEPPRIISTTGCITYPSPKGNGYTVYDAVIDKDSDKKYDIIKAFPPRMSAKAFIERVKNEKWASKVLDGSGKGKPTYVMVPKGVITDENMIKLGLRNARIEAYYIWDEEMKNVRNAKSLGNVAKSWMTKRKEVVEKRLNSIIKDNEASMNRINLIEKFVKNGMNKWDTDKIEETLGKEDTDIVLSTPQRAFLPENIEKNKLRRSQLQEEISDLKNRVAHIRDEVMKEAYEILDKQNKYFDGK